MKAASVIDTSRAPLPRTKSVQTEAVAPASSIDFRMQSQCHSNWCWAAVAASVATYFDKATTWSQCAVANSDLQRKDCCDAACGADNVPYNVANTLGSPLNRVGHLDKLKFRQLTREELRQEIEAGRPVCARIVWSGGGGHFAVIAGYSSANDSVLVRDPFHGPSEVKFDRFCRDYAFSHGRWTHTLSTKPRT